jgi:NAD(P)-dependent dehydrogenase (short-subunit alcohol dehydrogenase family)
VDPKGKVALVTGGGARLGRAISLGLGEAGAHVAVHYYHSAERAHDTVAQARALGVQALAVQADLREPQSAPGLLSTVQERLGPVDILVHSASPFVATPLAELTLPTWRAILGVVAESFWLLVQGLAPGMADRGQGAVVAILDRGAFDPWPGYLAHGTAKSALWALVRSLAVGLAPAVRVNALVPGPVLAPPGLTEAQKARYAQATLLGRWGSPQDVADAVLYLVRAPYVTGEALFVDGGERWGHRLPQD